MSFPWLPNKLLVILLSKSRFQPKGPFPFRPLKGVPPLDLTDGGGICFLLFVIFCFATFGGGQMHSRVGCGVGSSSLLHNALTR